jgi:hypothetical protein
LKSDVPQSSSVPSRCTATTAIQVDPFQPPVRIAISKTRRGSGLRPAAKGMHCCPACAVWHAIGSWWGPTSTRGPEPFGWPGVPFYGDGADRKRPGSLCAAGRSFGRMKMPSSRLTSWPTKQTRSGALRMSRCTERVSWCGINERPLWHDTTGRRDSGWARTARTHG